VPCWPGQMPAMIQDHLAGGLSVCLEQLEAAAGQDSLPGLRRLRHQVETGPLSGLAMAAADALAVADRLCWDSLARGDIPAFACQARVSAELRQFGVCARLLADN
jgi:hypothetical protein